MRHWLAPIALLALAGCGVPLGPVEVSRFHVPETAALGPNAPRGTIAVIAGDGEDQTSYRLAVEQALVQAGYTIAPPESALQTAQIRIERQALRNAQAPVRVGLRAGNTSYSGANAGVGLSIPFQTGPQQRVATDLVAVIREKTSGKVLWEGRASFTVSATSPLAQGSLAAPRLAQALFSSFPGQSGETIKVP
jgi:hypothetical protein